MYDLSVVIPLLPLFLYTIYLDEVLWT